MSTAQGRSKQKQKDEDEDDEDGRREDRELALGLIDCLLERRERNANWGSRFPLWGGPALSDPPAAVASSGLRREWWVRGSTQASTLGDRQDRQDGLFADGHWMIGGCSWLAASPRTGKPASPGAYT
jgi:hypothetical protein